MTKHEYQYRYYRNRHQYTFFMVLDLYINMCRYFQTTLISISVYRNRYFLSSFSIVITSIDNIITRII
ncbi:hypothetical protein Hanom_Chr15g01392051 [Helianthus anomalus]